MALIRLLGILGLAVSGFALLGWRVWEKMPPIPKEYEALYEPYLWAFLVISFLFAVIGSIRFGGAKVPATKPRQAPSGDLVSFEDNHPTRRPYTGTPAPPRSRQPPADHKYVSFDD